AVDGRTAASIRDADAAVEGALGQAYQLVTAQGANGSAAPPAAVLRVPPWVEADRANLAALAAAPNLDPHDATRAWMTARWIVRLARTNSRTYFASFGVRGAAFLIDLLLVTVPAVVAWFYIVATTSGSINDLIGSEAVNAALFGYTALALLYFVLAEGFFGTTLGKRMLGLRVRARDLGAPGPIAVLLRNLPKLGTLTLLGVFGVFVVILIQRGATIAIPISSSLNLAISASYPIVGFLVGGLALLGGISALVMFLTPERQRFGDLLADTFVLAAPSSPSEVPGAVPSAGAPFG
ncbi:MAG: RDD family protein, partial [Thermoplasmata archaeon]|nr:RDD family protein [Thermoplasmata archaeon]